jgi:hypothetical protein
MAGLLNINAWVVKSEKQKALVKMKATEYIRKKTKAVLMEALRVTPQWSGNTALNWKLETTRMGGSGYIPTLKEKPWNAMLFRGEEPRQAGDQRTIATNLMMVNNAALDDIKWNSKIKLVNHAPAMELMDAGLVKLRPVNKIPLGDTVVAHLKVKFGFLR